MRDPNNKNSHSVMSYALGKCPFYDNLLQVITNFSKLKGTIDLISFMDGFFLFKFNCVEDLEIIIANGP